MSERSREPRSPTPSEGAGDQAGDAAGLSDLDRRLRAARARQATGGRKPTSIAGGQEGMGAGLRIAVELLAAVMVGTGIGWALDIWLGTRPWLLIVFFVVGSAAGFLNVYRTAKELDERAKARKAAAKADGQESGRP